MRGRAKVSRAEMQTRGGRKEDKSVVRCKSLRLGVSARAYLFFHSFCGGTPAAHHAPWQIAPATSFHIPDDRASPYRSNVDASTITESDPERYISTIEIMTYTKHCHDLRFSILEFRVSLARHLSPSLSLFSPLPFSLLLRYLRKMRDSGKQLVQFL
jgi:hypothetical protein